MEDRRRRGHGQRSDRPQFAATPTDRLLEGAAIRTRLQMSLDLPLADDSPVGLGDRPDHAVAAHLTPRFHLPQADPRLVHRLARGVRGCLERRGDLAELEVAELPHHQRRALPLGQFSEVVDQFAEPLPRFRSLDQTRPGSDLLGNDPDRLPTPPHGVDRLVARDPVDPGPQLDVPPLAGQRPQDLDHRRLERVLGVLPAADQRQAEAIEVLVIALEDRLERAPVATLGAPHEPLVRRESHVSRLSTPDRILQE
jgi:hypothetical protein